jgi:hypothetical protein
MGADTGILEEDIMPEITEKTSERGYATELVATAVMIDNSELDDRFLLGWKRLFSSEY